MAPAPSRTRTARGSSRGRPTRWLLLGAAVLAVVGAIAGTVTLLNSGHRGPVNSLVTPERLGDFTLSTQLGRQMGVSQLEKNIITRSSGQARNLVSAVYQAGSAVTGGAAAQVMLFIGGQLPGVSPVESIESFTQHFKDAMLTSAGSLGGKAACVGAQSGGTDGSTVCAWFDHDTFGELVSPNMTVGALANEMRSIRPSVERVVG